jgi:hypothetical protein
MQTFLCTVKPLSTFSQGTAEGVGKQQLGGKTLKNVSETHFNSGTDQNDPQQDQCPVV